MRLLCWFVGHRWTPLVPLVRECDRCHRRQQYRMAMRMDATSGKATFVWEWDWR